MTTAAEQQALLLELNREHPVLQHRDQIVYLISCDWYYKFEEFVENGNRAEAPGKINNDILLEEGQLKDDLIQSYDFMVLSEPVWVALRQWYGGGPAIQRNTIVNKDQHLEVEIYPYRFLVSIVDVNYLEWSETFSRFHYFSKTETVSKVFSVLCEMFKAVYVEELKLEKVQYRLQVATMGEDFRVVSSSMDQTTLENTGWKQSNSETPRLMLEAKLLPTQTWLSEKRNKKKAKMMEYENVPSGGYSSGSMHFTTTSGINPFSNEYKRNTVAAGVNIGNKIKPSAEGVCGLDNLGNTCYMNASLQALVRCTKLKEYFNSDDFLGDLSPKSTLALSLSSVLSLMSSGEHCVVTPGELKKQLGVANTMFKGYRQHDAEEFISFLIDKVSQETVKTPDDGIEKVKKSKSPTPALAAWRKLRSSQPSSVSDLFQGQYKSELQCNECRSMSVSFDGFVVLPLAIPAAVQDPKVEQSVLSLNDCLNEFGKKETLGDSEKWYCSNCNELRQASKKLTLLSDFMPRILIIQLKRFTALGVKVREPVRFHKELNMDAYCEGDVKLRYELVSVTKHHGVCGGGHYTSQSLCQDGSWREFSDASVLETELNPTDPNAYLLYYQLI